LILLTTSSAILAAISSFRPATQAALCSAPYWKSRDSKNDVPVGAGFQSGRALADCFSEKLP